MHSPESVEGVVERVIYQNAENGFAVFVIKHRFKEITVKGLVPSLTPGERVSLKGTWTTHPKFGKQFDAQSCKTELPTTLVGIKKYLASGMIKGIGPVYAQKLIDAFGVDVLDVIDQQPERLKSVSGIGVKRIECIISAWQEQKEISHIMMFLQEKGISQAYATKIYKKYGDRAIEVLTENPYRLSDDIWGIGFKIADTIAQKMGIAHDSQKRVASGILYLLNAITSAGHLYMLIDELKEKTLSLLEIDETEKITLALHQLFEEEKIKVISLQDKHFVCLSKFYFMEKGIAQKIATLLSHPAERFIDVHAWYQRLRKQENNTIALNDDQQHGIITALQEKITIITGGPGTGKTTLIKTVLTILDAEKVSYKLAAPTGRAAKRITESTGKPASTIHRLLEFDVSTMGFSKNESNAIQADVIIIDEASMIDIFLAYAILKAIPLGSRLLLIGDVDQLPSVGPGNVLLDIIASKRVPTILLTQIFRQAQGSLIVTNAHRINQGEFPISSLPDVRKDFVFIKEEDPVHVPAHLEHIFAKGLKKFNLSKDTAMVLVPMNKGVVGTHVLNDHLQTMLNGSESSKLVRSGTSYKVGDRVMQIRNNYDKFIFNGDMGYIQRIDHENQLIQIDFDGKEISYEFSDLDELVLAYAISIHKSQGAEYDAVIIPLFMQHFTLLARNLLYTAVTRAKKLCIIIGQPKALAIAIKNNKGIQRSTFLTEYLTTDLICR